MRSKSRLARVLVGALLVLPASGVAGAGGAGGNAGSVDPAAVAAVERYVAAVEREDYAAAFGLLPSGQQRYFIDVDNFASNAKALGYRVLKHRTVATRGIGADAVEVDVEQTVAADDFANARRLAASVREPYFAVRDAGRWGVKELGQPWKSYAPRVQGENNDVSVTVNRVAFYEKIVHLDCAIANRGTVPVQVLPLLQSKLKDEEGRTQAALNAPDFPENDRGFFEGARIYPGHQAVGFINFPLPSKTDARVSYTLTVGPAIAEGGSDTFAISVGPFVLPKL